MTQETPLALHHQTPEACEEVRVLELLRQASRETHKGVRADLQGSWVGLIRFFTTIEGRLMKAIGHCARLIAERRLSTLDHRRTVVFLSLDGWLDEDQAMSELGWGDGLSDVFCDFVERMTGKRPGPETLLIERLRIGRARGKWTMPLAWDH